MAWKEEPLTIVIDSKEIAGAYEKFFDDIWNNAKR